MKGIANLKFYLKILPCQDFCFGTSFWRKYSIYFQLWIQELEIQHLLKQIIFKYSKPQKKTKVHKIHDLKVVFFHKKIFAWGNLIFSTLRSLTGWISSNLSPLPWKSMEWFSKKLRQSKNLGNAIFLSEIGLQIISRAILSEIVPNYNILVVCITNYILLYFSGDFGFQDVYIGLWPLKIFY